MVVHHLNVAMNICADINGTQRMNPDDFSDPLTFSVAPLAGQSVHLSWKIKSTKGIVQTYMGH